MTDGNNISLLPDTTSPPALPRLFVRLAVAQPPMGSAAGTERAPAAAPNAPSAPAVRNAPGPPTPKIVSAVRAALVMLKPRLGLR